MWKAFHNCWAAHSCFKWKEFQWWWVQLTSCEIPIFLNFASIWHVLRILCPERQPICWQTKWVFLNWLFFYHITLNLIYLLSVNFEGLVFSCIEQEDKTLYQILVCIVDGVKRLKSHINGSGSRVASDWNKRRWRNYIARQIKTFFNFWMTLLWMNTLHFSEAKYSKTWTPSSLGNVIKSLSFRSV